MGITIHWEGTVKDKETVDKIVSYAKFFADSLGWPCTYVKYPSVAYNDYIYNQNHMEKPSYSWVTSWDKETYDRNHTGSSKHYLNPKYQEEAEEGETEGVIIDPKAPMNTASIAIEFYPWKGEYRMSTFCKTQVFNDKEISNVIAHELIISMLETIKNTWMPNLEIHDEGDFLNDSRKKFNESLKYWKENGYSQQDIDKWTKEWKEGSYNFEKLMKSHGSNLKLINSLGGTFTKLGFKEDQIKTPAKKSFIEDLDDKDKDKDKRLKA